jgi:hypothetical protein
MVTIYLFKVKDYTTELVGKMYHNELKEKIFYVQRADGTKYEYPEHRIEWCRPLVTMTQ